MSSFFWNVCDFNKMSKHYVVRDWVFKEGLQFGCLLETRVKQKKTENIVITVFQDWCFMIGFSYLIMNPTN